MTFRKIISLSVGLSFMVLLITGILSYFNEYSRITATLHTVFGILFTAGAVLHMRNNFRSIKMYSKGRIILFVSLVALMFISAGYFQVEPLGSMMDFGARSKAKAKKELNLSEYEVIEMNGQKAIELTINLLRSEHYWHPQMAVWLEDDNGNYLETLFVSKATAKGLFFGGRSKDNFKEFDEAKDAVGDFRRVNALPVWSHKRGVQYSDGMYVPTHRDDFPDAITGETITDNFNLNTSTDRTTKFRVRVELNVAFDDNEYYSEYDFPNDEVFHSGTGQLGQPSIIFETMVDMEDGKQYYLMELVGHGHQSGQTGELFTDLSTLTTAKRIVERIVVGAKKNT
ncbi:DUF4405 domain-containing protein [Flagellimonas allohymeniacidonis]|uniref:DUF4405 domain-containing protein n=1 Tax=Flagellimonas allohymeniacidonis TaxID=2517819 RepID=A0A4Q8QJA4_9FLAO|nr:DUF4405 domain-containing protein [Allomuricauda hymeniacidonis]TAI48813.1 hypothetical protein EW142_03170 [Allomuricauda hymeniacidonis]